MCVVERLADRLEGVVAAVQAHGARAVPIQADLATRPVPRRRSNRRSTLGQYRRRLLNHAAMSWFTPFLELSDEAWETELNVNLTSHFVLARGPARRWPALVAEPSCSPPR